MGDDEIVRLFMNKVQDLVNALHLHGEQLYDNQIVEKVLRSLPYKFNFITIAIEESKDLTQLTLSDLLDILQTYDHSVRMYNALL